MHAKSLLLAAAFSAAALASPVLAAPATPDPTLHAQALELLTKGIASAR